MRWCALIVLVVACKRVTSDAGPPTPERLARACIKYAACDPFGGTVSSCIRDSSRVESVVSVYRPSQIRCIAEVGGDCEDLLACACTDGACSVEACATPGSRSCNGTELDVCSSDGVLTATDCAVFGETCNDTDGFPRCGIVGARFCQGPRCDGDVLVDCVFNEEHRVDCPTLYAGGQCGARGVRCGFDDGCSAEASAFCIGDTVSACVLGEVVLVDCASVGYSRCTDGRCVR